MFHTAGAVVAASSPGSRAHVRSPAINLICNLGPTHRVGCGRVTWLHYPSAQTQEGIFDLFHILDSLHLQLHPSPNGLPRIILSKYRALSENFCILRD